MPVALHICCQFRRRAGSAGPRRVVLCYLHLKHPYYQFTNSEKMLMIEAITKHKYVLQKHTRRKAKIYGWKQIIEELHSKKVPVRDHKHVKNWLKTVYRSGMRKRYHWKRTQVHKEGMKLMNQARELND